MKKFYILTLALLFCVSAFAQDAETGPVPVPGLTSENITIANASFANGLNDWTHTDQWATNNGAIRIESGNGSIAAGEMVKQTVTGKGAGTYVLTVKYKFDRNSWRGATANMGHACLFITNNTDVNFKDIDRDGPGVSVFHDPTGNNWTDGSVVYTTDSASEDLVIGFGDQTGTGKGQIYCDDFVLTYYPTLDQEAVKALLGMKYEGDLIDGNYVMEKSISLNETSKTIEDKTPFTLTATIDPAEYSSLEKGVIWSTSNEDTATVDENGEVTPAGAGTCDIIATSKADGLISAKCELTVNISQVEVTEVTVSIEGEDAEPKIEETKTLQLLATVEPEDATIKRVIWSSSDESLATVDENGLVTAIKAGEVTITATSEMVETVKGTITLTVFKNAVTEVELSETEAEIEIGKTIDLTATVTPENATYPEITWASSDDAIATVDESGKVTGIAAGEAEITATADGVSATCKVTVKYIDVEDITLNATEEKIVVGAEFTLTATVEPSNATEPAVTWTSSDEAVATVADGVVTGIGIGTTTITAKAGEKTATCTFEVVAAVELTSETLNIITNPLFDASTWNEGWKTGSGWSQKTESKDQVYGGKAYARLYSDPLSPGENGDFVTQTITLDKPGVYSLSAYARASQNHSGGLSEDQFGLLFINEGENIPTEYDGLNCAKVRTSGWEWIHKSVVITITEPNTTVTIGYGLPKECPSIRNGNLECSDFVLKYYPTTLDAAAVNACANKLVYTMVKAIELPETLALNAGNSETLTAKVTPEDATNAEVVWTTSDAKIATVDEEGKVTAVDGGTAVITATSVADSMIKAECAVTVTVPVTSLVILDEEGEEIVEGTVIEFHTGHEYNLTAVVGPDNATDKTVTWTSSDPEVVDFLDEEGLLDGLKAGEVTITASAGNLSVEVKVKVTDPEIPVTAITLDKTETEMLTGSTLQLKATLSPDNATSKDITWASSDKTIATVDTKGLVTALKAGVVTISATANKIKATCEITISDPFIAVTGITLDEIKIDGLIEGETTKLTATVLPDNATDPKVSWSSSDEAVATVDEEGTVTAVAPGTATITATAGEASAMCKITVIAKPVAVDGIVLNETEVVIVEGAEFELGYTINPENATDKTVTWSSSNEEVATVDATGKVTTIAAGEAIITATAGEKTAECKFIVKKAVATVTISKTEATLLIGDTLELTATIDPADAIVTEITWSSSDESIATVDENGMVTAIAVGEVIITAEAGEKTATCKITVNKPSGIELIGFDSKSPVQVYDFNGRYISDKLEGLQAGYYIIRQGNNAKKIHIK